MHTDKAIQPALVPADPWFDLPPGDFEKLEHKLHQGQPQDSEEGYERCAGDC